MRVVVTRPEPGARATARRLRGMGHEPVLLPLSEIVGLRVEAWPAPEGFAAVAVTSANAVRLAPPELIADFATLPCHAVGARSAQAAQEAGFEVVVEATGDVARLAEALVAHLPRGARVLYPCGRVRRPELEAALNAAGLEVAPVETYDTRTPPRSAAEAAALDERTADAVLLYSAEAARAIAPWLDHPALLRARLICLSRRVAAALDPRIRARCTIAATPDEDALLALL